MIFMTEIPDVLDDKAGHIFNYVEFEAGCRAIDRAGEPFPKRTPEAAREN
jgi:hypothetical protein